MVAAFRRRTRCCLSMRSGLMSCHCCAPPPRGADRFVCSTRMSKGAASTHKPFRARNWSVAWLF